MRLGILTYHRSYNYGAFIQCYSLVNRIKVDFPEIEVEVIDYNTQSSYYGYKLKLENSNAENQKILEKQYKIFSKFQELYLPLSKYKLCSDDYNKLLVDIKDKYDIIVVGSDAVWNWNGKGFPNAYFLGGDWGCKKISYAASSHGIEYYDICENDVSKLKNLFDSFDYIGVREETTKKMVRFSGSEKKVYINCDPTVLLNLDELPVSMENLKRKLGEKGIDFNKPIVGLMAGISYGKMIKQYFKDTVQIVAVFEPNKYADFYLDDLNPFEWARVFSLFDITLTHFFHGTMLSLINGTPVIAVEVANSYNKNHVTKIKNILTRTNLLKFHKTLCRKNDLISKILYKLGLKNDKKFWWEICEQMKVLMENPPQKMIKQALDEETFYYESFRDKLTELILGGKKN